MNLAQLLFAVLMLLVASHLPPSIAPPPTVHCRSNGTSSCRVHNTYHVWPDRTMCEAARVVYPTSEQELLQAVAQAVKEDQSMKVVTRVGNSIPKWACPRGLEGLAISTRDYANEVVIDKEAMTATADSGVGLRQLVDRLAEEGLALPHTPYWEGVTLGGLLSTGCHGSSLFGKGGAVHEYLVAIRLVVPALPSLGYAKIISLTHNNNQNPNDQTLFNAAKVSLGLLGVISQVTFALQPQFKRSVTKQFRSDDDLENQIIPFGRAHEFGDMTWFPAKHKVLLSMDDRVPMDTQGDGVNDFGGFKPIPSLVLKGIRAIEEAAERLSSTTTKCLVSALQTASLFGQGTGLKNNEEAFTHYPVIGLQNRMQTAGSCLSSNDPTKLCAWDSSIKGFFYHETAFLIGLDNISSFVMDVKRLRDMDPSSFCGLDLYSGLLMRFVKKSDALLGSQVDAVAIDMAYYRAPEASVPRLHEDVIEEIEQIGLFKYKAVPHWGKNRPLAFQDLGTKYKNMEKFKEVREALDPHGLFSSDWSDAVLGIAGNVTSDKDYCALEGLCVCTQDRHCAPDRGYYCMAGKVFKEARVCRLDRWPIHKATHPLHTYLNAWLQTWASSLVEVSFKVKGLLVNLLAWLQTWASSLVEVSFKVKGLLVNLLIKVR